MNIKILTVCFNEPLFLEYQYKLLKKYLLNDFTFYVYDNSENNTGVTNTLLNICHKYGIIYNKVARQNNERQGPSQETGMSLDYAINNIIQNHKPEYGMILDSDMFLIKPLNFFNKLAENDFIGVQQQREHIIYYNNQLCYLNYNKLLNFDKYPKFLPGNVEGINCDCGGYLYNYFKNNNIKHIGIEKIINSGTVTDRNIDNKGFIKKIDSIDFIINDPKLLNFYKKEIEISYNNNNKIPITGPLNDYGVSEGTAFSEIFDENFLHFRAGSNWINHSNNTTIQRKENLFNYLNSIL